MPKRSAAEETSRTKPITEDDPDLFSKTENSRDPDDKVDDDSSDSGESEYSGLESETDDTTEDDDLDSINDDEEENDDEKSADNSSEDDDNGHDEDEGEDEENLAIQDPGLEAAKKPIDIPQENENDTSDEEDSRNTVGNIPVEWYSDYPHIGYNLQGEKILKPATADELDDFLSKMDDPNYWKTVKDKATMKEVVLTDEELDIINRIQNAKFPGTDYDPYEPYVDFFTGDKMIHPLTNAPEPKSRHVPSKWEHKRVIKIVRAIRNGWIKPKKTDTDKPRFYMLWDKDDEQSKPRHPMHIPAPKMKLPGHEESYNPPPEYLPTDEEIAAWEEMDPEDRPQNFLPKKYSSLRLVPAYNRFVQERFERCLDLYLCPRQRKMRIQVNPEDLLPKLPKPRDLQPFPTTEAILYKGHEGIVRCISVDPTGQWLASGSDDKSVKFWEVCTGRCLKTVWFDGPVQSIAWNPNPSVCLLVAALEQQAVIVNPHLGDKLICSATDEMIDTFTPPAEAKESAIQWNTVDRESQKNGIRLILKHSKVSYDVGSQQQPQQLFISQLGFEYYFYSNKAISQVTWHNKGDYFATVLPQGGNKSVFIHQLSKRRSQINQLTGRLTRTQVAQALECPFQKAKGLIQRVLFHPSRPFLFVATQRYIRVYNLMKQEMTKKLVSAVKWISSMAIHPKGDNLIIGSYDKRLCWFDMDLSTKAYKTLRHHKKAIRQVAFHRFHPLFASASDDGTVIVCHGMVYNDLLQNPLIVPVKILKGHKVTAELGALDCQFHPIQPWLFTAGADHTVRLFT